MEFRKFGSKYLLRLDKGEEIVATLKDFCSKEGIKLGSISGIGAANKVIVGLFETGPKKYHSKTFEGDYEIAPLVGNVSTMNGETYLHLHITLGDGEHKAFAGHLNEAWVSATFECVIDTIDGEIDRKLSEEIGLNLIDFNDQDGI